MVTRRGKRVVIWSGVIGVVVLAGVGVAVRETLQLDDWAWELDHGNKEGRIRAAQRLGAIGSPGAVRVLVDRLHVLLAPDVIQNLASKKDLLAAGEMVFDAPLVSAILGSLLDLRYSSAPELISAAVSPDQIFAGVAAQVLCLIQEGDTDVAFLATFPSFLSPGVDPDSWRFQTGYGGTNTPTITTVPSKDRIGRILRSVKEAPDAPAEVRQAAAESLAKIESTAPGPEDGGE